ncbi:hypothetical protein [Pseudanabaena mucicola]|uniref:Uncharacterized protein n=1 Tax=Pseudanabaena mucicola FACHB-723 TaxID=2692860 RepID=A0ABR7ZW08_9CYAN|nr:hypothetical protein [Pseudanabaena mucicola]MBD2187997.1 hypothetical protein [Pseudanabaena mucicola FACHB-723]
MPSFYPGQKAKRVAQEAKIRYESAFENLKKDETTTNRLAERYGDIQLYVMTSTVKRFINFLENSGRRTSESDKQILEGIDFSVQQINEYKAATVNAEKYLMGAVKSATAATAGYTGAIGVATSIGAASTGTAISSLSGAAAWNATLAWFGGGAIAAGGGGMAVGAIVLGSITVVPALAIGGFFAAREGEKAMTRARQYEAQVNVAIAEMEVAGEFAQQVRSRITELRGVFEEINSRIIIGLDYLEAHVSDSQPDRC